MKLTTTPSTEHPRVCGENAVAATRLLANNRNIPAYAGKTIWRRVHKTYSEEHPRVCGENSLLMPGCKAPIGTSPRMRGKLVYAPVRKSWSRNIPAYAGKTGLSNLIGPLLEEHPRVCGENGNIHISLAFIRGTSPRMRGKLTRANWKNSLRRNIPAYAGKTSWSSPQ